MSGAERERVVAIHQPNFLPWLGFFNKLARADTFVFLDDVQYERKSAGTWTNRCRLLVAGKPSWVTAPVVRAGGGVRSINEMELDDSQPWRRKTSRTIESNYRPAPHYEDVWPVVESVLTYDARKLAEFNEHAIRLLCDRLGLSSTRLLRASDVSASTAGTEQLIFFTRALTGGCTYRATEPVGIRTIRSSKPRG